MFYHLARLPIGLLTVLVLGLLSLPTTGIAQQFNCRSDVVYKWKHSAPDQEYSVKWGTVVVKGDDEAKLKARLQERLDRETTAARDECQKVHENLTGCISARFASAAMVHAELGFASRKALEEAILSDCKMQVGQCQEPTKSDIVCQAEASSENSSSSEGKADGKEKKKK